MRAPAPGNDRRVSSRYAVTGTDNRVRFRGVLLCIQGHFFLDASRFDIPGVTMPAIDYAGERVYPIEVPPVYAQIVGAYWAALAYGAKGVYRVPELAEELQRLGLHRKALGGRTEAPLDDTTTRFWFHEVARMMRLPLTSRATSDGKRAMGIARTAGDLDAGIAERESRARSGRKVYAGAEQALQREDFSSWREALPLHERNEDDQGVLRALLAEMETGSKKAKDLAETARLADGLGRRWLPQGIRAEIHWLRVNGAPIAATTEGNAGSWIEADPVAYASWAEAYKGRMREIWEGANSMRVAKALWFGTGELTALAPAAAPSEEAVARINRARRRRKSGRRKPRVAVAVPW